MIIFLAITHHCIDVSVPPEYEDVCVWEDSAAAMPAAITAIRRRIAAR